MADQSALSFPDLFRESYVDYADCRIRYTTEAAPDELVARLHLVAVTADGNVVVCRSKQGWRFLPETPERRASRCTISRGAN
jgi:8-oxo-dGTP diphosphatase